MQKGLCEINQWTNIRVYLRVIRSKIAENVPHKVTNLHNSSFCGRSRKENGTKYFPKINNNNNNIVYRP